MKKLLIQVYYSIIYYIPGIIREFILGYNYKNTICLKSYLDYRWGVWHKQNWGDDMNYYLCKLWFNKSITNYATSVFSWLFNRNNYALIGSILQSANNKTIVWGSGLISENEIPKQKPKKILAVRGPLTRKILIENNIECPEVYGDPVLLLPKFYNPKITKKFKLGIITHINDENDKIINKILNQNKEVCHISLSKYNDWRDVVDKVCACETIISSSLHGLILADAYKIPNIWVVFSDKVYGNGFKFQDYFMSVGRGINKPIQIKKVNDVLFATKHIKHDFVIKINLQPLIKNCPFSLNIN